MQVYRKNSPLNTTRPHAHTRPNTTRLHPVSKEVHYHYYQLTTVPNTQKNHLQVRTELTPNGMGQNNMVIRTLALAETLHMTQDVQRPSQPDTPSSAR